VKISLSLLQILVHYMEWAPINIQNSDLQPKISRNYTPLQN